MYKLLLSKVSLCIVYGGRNDIYYGVKLSACQISNNNYKNETKGKDGQVICVTSFVHFLLENMTSQFVKGPSFRS